MGFGIVEDTRFKKAPSGYSELAKTERCLVCPRDNVQAQCGNKSPKMTAIGSTNPDIYFLGVAPSEVDDLAGHPFSRNSLESSILHEYLESTFQDFYVKTEWSSNALPRKITNFKSDIRFNNLLKCHDKTKPNELSLDCCRSFLEEDIIKSKPKIIVGFGEIPLKAMVGVSGIKEWRGRKIPIKIGDHNCWYFALDGLDELFKKRDPEKKYFISSWEEVFKHDLNKIKKLLKSSDVSKAFVIPKEEYRKNIEFVLGKGPEDLEIIKKWLTELMNLPKTALDVETSALKIWTKNSKIYTVAIGTHKKVYAFPIEHPRAWGGQYDEIKKLFVDFLLEYKGTKVCHNDKFEKAWCFLYGGPKVLFETRWGCTMTRAFLLDERSSKRKDSPLSLDMQCLMNFGFRLKDQSTVDVENILASTLEELLIYNAMDSKYTDLLDDVQESQFDSALNFNYEHKLRLSRTLVLTENKGFPVDSKKVGDFSKKLELEIEDLDHQIKNLPAVKLFEKTHGIFNPDSNPHLVKMFRDVLKLESVKQTKSAKEDSFSTDKDVLDIYAAKGIKLAELIKTNRELSKLKSTYLDQIPEMSNYDGLIHTNFSHLFTSTCRLCVAKGTLIDIVREVSGYPKGVPIELLKPGDLAYSYDDNLNLTIKPIIWAGVTGHKSVVRVHWLGLGRQKKGFTDLTENHEVRLTNGDYIKAKDLKRGQSVLALSRGIGGYGYPRLYATGCVEISREHRFVYETLTGKQIPDGYVIHHIDHNKKNNLLENLKLMTAGEHATHHGLIFANTPEAKTRSSITIKKSWAEGKIKPLKGISNGSFLSLTKRECLKIIAKTKCVSREIMKLIDFDTFKAKLRFHNLSLTDLSLRYSRRNRTYISKNKLIKSIKTLGFHRTHKFYGLNYDRLRKLIDYYDIPFVREYERTGHLIKTKYQCLRVLAKIKGDLSKLPFDVFTFRLKLKKLGIDLKTVKLRYNGLGDYVSSNCVLNNHVITQIEYLDDPVDVYDIEVADTHNFIANEICVHNSSSSPNLQNFPARKNSYIREIICAPPGYWMVSCDYGQIEAKVIAMLSKDPKFVKYVWDKFDVHGDWAARAAKKDPRYAKCSTIEEFLNDPKKKKSYRAVIKNRLVFPWFYGAGKKSVGDYLGFSDQHRVELYDEFWELFGGIKKWQGEVGAFYDKNGYIETKTGYRRHGPMTHNEKINTPVQSLASDMVTDAMNRLSLKSYELDKPQYQAVLNLHDDLTFLIPDETLDYDIEFIAKEMCILPFDFVNVPISIEVKLGKNWGEMKELTTFETTDFIKNWRGNGNNIYKEAVCI